MLVGGQQSIYQVCIFVYVYARIFELSMFQTTTEIDRDALHTIVPVAIPHTVH